MFTCYSVQTQTVRLSKVSVQKTRLSHSHPRDIETLTPKRRVVVERSEVPSKATTNRRTGGAFNFLLSFTGIKESGIRRQISHRHQLSILARAFNLHTHHRSLNRQPISSERGDIPYLERVLSTRSIYYIQKAIREWEVFLLLAIGYQNHFRHWIWNKTLVGQEVVDNNELPRQLP